jgi:hypothetical protein
MPARKKNPLTQARRICLSLPEATEKVAWGSPTFRVKDKIFASFAAYHHGDTHVALWCNAPAGAQEELVESGPKHFFRPAYVGHRGWVGVRLDTGLDWNVVAMVVREAYKVTAPKRLAALVE